MKLLKLAGELFQRQIRCGNNRWKMRLDKIEQFIKVPAYLGDWRCESPRNNERHRIISYNSFPQWHVFNVKSNRAIQRIILSMFDVRQRTNCSSPLL